MSILGAVLCASVPNSNAQTRSGPDLAASISERLDNFYRDIEADRRPLRVVYFHPADTQPLKDYRRRLTRIMLDVQSFYRDEMARNGFGPKSFSLEMQDEKLILHVVKGKRPAAEYSHESGNVVSREISAALADSFRLSEEFVLVVNAMCHQKDDGSYFFHAPYYGSGGTWRGLCHVADCVLDITG